MAVMRLLGAATAIIGARRRMCRLHMLAAAAFVMVAPLGVCAKNAIVCPMSRAVYQRNGDNLARIPVAGTCNNGFERIEARAVPRAGYKGTATDWKTVALSPGTRYSNELTVAGGWYDVEVRMIKGGAVAASLRVERVGVGEIFITCGQSNAANGGSPRQSPTDDRVNAFNLKKKKWQLARDPQPYASLGGGSPWPDFGSLLARRTETPVAVIAVGVGGTKVSQWLPGAVGTRYARIAKAIKALRPYGGFRAILWHQGESDSLAGTKAQTYALRLNALISRSRADAGFEVPWGVALASWSSRGSNASGQAEVIAGQRAVIAGTPGTFKGAETDSFHVRGWSSSGSHFNDLGLRDHGRQWVEAVWRAVLADDRDRDGLPDLWSWMHFGHADGTAAGQSRAADDADGDGVCNLAEYRALTDPRNPGDALWLSVVAKPDGGMHVAWPSVPGCTYRLGWTDALDERPWSGESPALSAYESDMTYDDDAEPGASMRFYRVTVEH